MPILSEKQTMLRKLMACNIALVEANLYLDSHPTCPMGIAYFNKHKAEYEALAKEYEEKYGPITVKGATPDKKWDWVTSPFPWERGES